MSFAQPLPLARIRAVLATLLMFGLAACAQNFNANVSRFQSQLPAPQGQSFAVVADDPDLAGGLEFSQYARLVEDRLAGLGYARAESPERATLIVRFDYGVDKGRERIRSTGIGYDPFYGPWRGGYARFGYGGWGGPWRYGLYDPWFDGGIDSYTVYTSGVSLKIDRRADGARLFEGQAEAVSTSNRLPYLVPNLVEAMFTNFPGNSGETVRISVAPEKQAPRQ